MLKLSTHIFLAGFFIALMQACGKDDLPPNPFDGNDLNDSIQTIYLEPSSIEGLQQNIFKPTCANSGCHDGTFEPDFRTIESTYYSLVYHDIIKQNPSNPLDYRVLPGNANQSIIMERLTVDIGGNSGVMPLAVDPNSDWENNKASYIQNLRDWINDGAKDVFGNASQSLNFKPQLLGFMITKTGNLTPLSRNIEGVIEIPNGTPSVDLYLAIDDRETPGNDFTLNDIQISISADDFSLASNDTLQFINAQNFMGYSATMIPYQFKFTINNPLGLWSQNQRLFLNIKVDDGDNGAGDLPGVYSMEHIKQYYSFKLL